MRRRMRVAARRMVPAIALAIAVATSFAGSTVWASEGGGAHGEHGCHADHWYFLNALPALRNNICGMLGDSYVEGAPVERGSHIPMSIVVALVSILFALAARKTIEKRDEAVVPQTRLTFFTFFEILVGTVYDMMERMMGEKYARQFMPLIAALAIFILFSNLAGAIPGLLPPTDNLNTTFALGSVVFFATHYAGVKEHGASYFKHFLGPIIKWYALPLMIIMVFIETISHLVRPASLAVRLMGNIFGDHKVLGIFLGFHLVLVPLPIQVLGLLVAVVQTLVFCLLSIVYIAMAVEHAEH